MEQRSAAAKKQYWIDPMKCVGCSKCARSCPAQAIDAALIIDADRCIGCGICDRYCWFGAVIVRTDGHVSDYHVHPHQRPQAGGSPAATDATNASPSSPPEEEA